MTYIMAVDREYMESAQEFCIPPTRERTSYKEYEQMESRAGKRKRPPWTGDEVRILQDLDKTLSTVKCKICRAEIDAILELERLLPDRTWNEAKRKYIAITHLNNGGKK